MACILHIETSTSVCSVAVSEDSQVIFKLDSHGGPNHATELPSTLMINLLFLRNRYGMGSTIAVMLIILCFVFALIINMIFKEDKGR